MEMTLYLGHAAILASNVLFLSATLLLRRAGALGGSGLLVLWLANIVAGLTIFVFRYGDVSQKVKTKDAVLDYLALMAWSCSYICIYGVSIALPKSITIPHLILAESAAPFIALAFFRDVRRDWSFPLDFFRVTAGFALIAFMAWIAWSEDGTSGIATDWSLFALIASLYTVSQAMARYLSKRRPAFWGPPRMSLMVVAGLGTLFLIFMPNVYTNVTFSYEYLALVIVAGIMMPLNRGCFLFGLRITPGTQAALLINLTLPLALVFHSIENHSLSATTVVHMVIYCAIALLLAFIKPQLGRAHGKTGDAQTTPAETQVKINCNLNESPVNSAAP